MANTPKDKHYKETIDCNNFAAFLLANGTVKIDGLGTFSLSVKKAHTCYVPKTGARMAVPENISVTFRPYRILKKILNTHGKKETTRT